MSYGPQAGHHDCCWGTRNSQAVDCHSHPWGKDQGSPLLHWLVELYLPCIPTLPDSMLAVQLVHRHTGCCLSPTALRNLVASPWLGSLPDLPRAPREDEGHSSPSTCCKGFNPIPVRVCRDKSMQQSHEVNLICHATLRKTESKEIPFI